MEGSKWSLTALWRYLTAEIGEERVAKLQDDIKDVVVKTCIAAESDITPALARLNRQVSIRHRGPQTPLAPPPNTPSGPPKQPGGPRAPPPPHLTTSPPPHRLASVVSRMSCLASM